MESVEMEGADSPAEETSTTEKRILLITEYYHPDTASSGRLMTDLATGLHELGLDVTVYTGQTNYYGSEPIREPRISTHKGVRVKRMIAPQLPPTTLFRRLFNWIVFSLWTFFALLVRPPSEDREIVFLTNPPFQSIAMWILCGLRKWNYTYIVHDVYPDQPVELGILRNGGVVETIWSWFQRRVYRDAHHIVTNGPMMQERLVENSKGFLTRADVTVIHNWEDETCLASVPTDENMFRRNYDLIDPFVVLYSGNIGLYHEFKTIIDAAANLTTDNIVFLFIGDGDAKADVIQYAKEAGVYETTVRFLPYQPRETIPYSLTAGDVNFVSVAKGFEGVNLSIKMYTAMAAGKPVLAIASPTDDESLIIDEYEMGAHVSHGEVKEVTQILKHWIENPSVVDMLGDNAQRAYEEKLTSDQAIEKYYTLFTHGAEAVEESYQDINVKSQARRYR